MQRRQFIESGSASALLALAVGAGLMPGRAAAQGAAWNKSAFESKTLADASKALWGAMPVESKDVVLAAPEIAENGNVVRMGVQSSIAGTTQVALLVEKNPTALTAVFDIPAGTDANVSTNVKMAQSSNVYALVKAGDKYYYSVKEVKVTLGGCGG